MQGGLGPAEDGVDAGDLPFAPSQIGGGRAGRVAPVVAGGVRRVDHAVVVVPAAILEFEQPPGLVEQLRREQPGIGDAAGARRALGGRRGLVRVRLCHGRLESFREEVIDPVQGAAQPGDPSVKLAAVLADQAFDGRVVAVLPGGDRDPHLPERQVQGPQQADQAGLGHLVAAVQPVPGRAVDRGRAQQAGPVVMPQRLDGQPAAPGHQPDGQQFLPHAGTVEPSPGAGSSAPEEGPARPRPPAAARAGVGQLPGQPTSRRTPDATIRAPPATPLATAAWRRAAGGARASARPAARPRPASSALDSACVPAWARIAPGWSPTMPTVMLSMVSANGRAQASPREEDTRAVRAPAATAIQYTPRAIRIPVVTTLLTLPETSQWRAEPSRKPPPSQTPNSAASGTPHRRLTTGPIATHAIRLSMPSRRKPILTSRCNGDIPAEIPAVRIFRQRKMGFIQLSIAPR